MMLEIGESVHVIERRQFETDVRRHFFGVVEGVDQSTLRVTGYAFVYDTTTTTFVRSEEKRTRVLSLAAGGLLVNVAPAGTDPENVRYVERDGQLVVTDGAAFVLDINEFGRFR